MSWGGKRRMSIEERLEYYSIPEPNSGCMLWLGSTDGRGYPKLAQDGVFRVVSHLVLERTGRLVPDGMCACHTCDNPGCIEETHLFVGTQRDNIHDMMKKGRQCMTAPGALKRARTHCEKGHLYLVSPRRNRNGSRICEICLRAKQLRRLEVLRRDSSNRVPEPMKENAETA